MSVFIIAEIGINHGGSLSRACEMISVAKDCGADAVKFQSYTVANLGYKNPPLNALLETCRFTPEQHFILKECADALGIEFMSTPFDREWAGFLVSMGVKRLKISSGKAHDRAFMAHVRALGVPLIISNGMCDPETFRDVIQPRDTVLYCVSEYPAPLSKIDFRQMARLRHSYFSVGYSDHSAHWQTCVLAAAAGASVVECHLTLDLNLPGPDHTSSLLPAEFAEMVRGVRACGQ